MKRLMLACCLLLAAGLSCTGSSLGFGPFPSSVFGNGVTAGVAGFVPGTIPGANEYAIVVLNTDATNTYDVTMTPAGGSAITRQALPCNVANFVASCSANAVLQVIPTGSTTPVALTVTPNATCTQQLVFIAVTTTTGTGGTGTTTVSLTQTAPTSIINCPGLAGLGT